MREVVATLAQEKDYLFVREADQAKGGGSLASLKEELNNTKTRDKLFETAGAPLCGTIAEDVLKFSAVYKDKETEFCMPGTMMEKKLVFDEEVWLYASPHNTGASQVEDELATQSRRIKLLAHWNPEFWCAQSCTSRTVRRAASLTGSRRLQRAATATGMKQMPLAATAGNAAAFPPSAARAGTPARWRQRDGRRSRASSTRRS
eukprot:3680892-Prymnesium_polylepis.1